MKRNGFSSITDIFFSCNPKIYRHFRKWGRERDKGQRAHLWKEDAGWPLVCLVHAGPVIVFHLPGAAEWPGSLALLLSLSPQILHYEASPRTMPSLCAAGLLPTSQVKPTGVLGLQHPWSAPSHPSYGVDWFIQHIFPRCLLRRGLNWGHLRHTAEQKRSLL